MALTINNTPREDWGPKKAANRTGDYAHLCQQPVRQEPSGPYLTPLSRKSSAGFKNPVFHREVSMADDGARDTEF